jgi:hypothetical protein
MRWIVEDTMVNPELQHVATVASSDNADGFRIVEARNAAILKDLCDQLRPLLREKGDLESSLPLVQALSVTRVPC